MSWESRFGGLFLEAGPIPRRPHDPAVAIASGSVVPWGPRKTPLSVGGAALDAASARGAAHGEALERVLACALPSDGIVEASFSEWPLDEPAVDPARWVLFHEDQHALPGFPFEPFGPRTRARWVAFRVAGRGTPCWVPEEVAFLEAKGTHRIGPATSTGLSAGEPGHPVLLRGLQEVIERDALLGAWWGRYPLEEHDPARVLRELGDAFPRANLAWRFYRARTPFSAHVTIATVVGDDTEGRLFAAGSACRETRRASFLKSAIEAVQGRHYVRYLLSTGKKKEDLLVPRSFADHALYYTVFPERLGETVLEKPVPSTSDDEARTEGFSELGERLARPVLFRDATPSFAAGEIVVLRVLVPGLQPLHGDHALPFLGGSLWKPRGLEAWRTSPPHPFP